MKSDSQNNNIFYKEFPILKDRTGLNAIKCENGQKGFYVCHKGQCQNYPFMCNQKKDCLCKKNHEKCLKILLQDFLNIFQNKIADTSTLIKQNDKLIDLFVQRVVNKAAKMKETFKAQVQAKSKTLFFSAQEIRMLTCIQNNDVKDLKGKDFYRICFQMELQQKLENNEGIDLKKQIQESQQIWEDFQKVLLQQFNLIQKKIIENRSGLYKERLFQKSKIAITSKENDNLKGFFNKKIKKTELLYRASQNQFKLNSFKASFCEIPNTLTLIQTQYGKKVGGFTPLVWKKQSNIFTPDTSNQTFIFSLTQNAKFLPIENTNSYIYNYSHHGPAFSSSIQCDICISQAANTSKDSLISFNSAFYNPNFKSSNQQTLRKFNGSPNNQYRVKLKQWQVWKITFYDPNQIQYQTKQTKQTKQTEQTKRKFHHRHDPSKVEKCGCGIF